MMRPKKLFGVDELRQIRSQYLSGISLKEIGEQFGTNKNVIKKAVVELGIFQENRSAMSSDVFKQRIREIGRVELLGDYKSTMTKTLFRCLLHGEDHLAFPGNILKGFGLKCCLKAGAAKYSHGLSTAAAGVYDEKIRILTNGKIKRVGDYIGSKNKIEHYCRTHDEMHLSTPGNILSGFGLSCCRVANFRMLGFNSNTNARELYDKKLIDRSDNRFKRLDEYVNAITPILHFCTIHREEHMAVPNKLLNGDGMKCCNTGVGWDTLENLLENKELCMDVNVDDPCQFYIYQVPDTEDCVKVGIAKNSYRRSRKNKSKDLYGDLISMWQCSTRRNAILLETAVLRDPSFDRPTEFVESLVFKAGQTEVRRVDIDSLVDHVQDLYDSLEGVGSHWASWALDRIPSLRVWEQKVLKGLVD